MQTILSIRLIRALPWNGSRVCIYVRVQNNESGNQIKCISRNEVSILTLLMTFVILGVNYNLRHTDYHLRYVPISTS